MTGSGSQICDVMQRLPTTLVITAAQSTTAMAPTSFNILLTIAVPNGRALGGQNVSVSFGDGSPAVTVRTSTDGSAAVVHTFAAAGKYNVTATYAGEAVPCLRCSHMQSRLFSHKRRLSIVYPVWRDELNLPAKTCHTAPINQCAHVSCR